MAPYRFVEMREEFVSEITSIYNHYILSSTATFHTKPLEYNEMKDIVFTGDRFKSYAIFDGGTMCGYCILSPWKKREAYDGTAEVTVYLNPSYTGKGIGSLAVKHLEQLAAQNGFHVLLAVICAENTPSINLFERLGYVKCAHYREVGRKFGRLLDVVGYQKIL